MEKFKRLYRLPNHRIRENTDMTYFVFCGKNWDYYFTKKNRDSEVEILENVVLVEKYNLEKYIDLDSDNHLLYLQYA